MTTTWPTFRKARFLTKQTLDPIIVQKTLLRNYGVANDNIDNFLSDFYDR